MRILSFLFISLFTLQSIAQKQLSNELIWASREFSTEYVYGINSMNNGEHYTTLEYGENGAEICKYSYANYGDKLETIVKSSDIKDENGNPINIESYSFNSDESKIMISTEVESIYRHSNRAYFYAYDVKSKTINSLSDRTKGKQRLAEISPAGDRIAFVRKNNIFIKNLFYSKCITVI